MLVMRGNLFGLGGLGDTAPSRFDPSKFYPGYEVNPEASFQGATRTQMAQDAYVYRFQALRRRDSIAAALLLSGQLKTPDQLKMTNVERSAMCGRASRNNYLSLLDPIGVIDVMGVPFWPGDLVGGKLERAFQPTPEQRFLIEFAAYAQSQRDLVRAYFLPNDLGLLGSTLIDSKNNNALIDDDGLRVLATPDGLQKYINRSEASINSFVGEFKLDGQPAFTTEVPGFLLNPVKPTDAELNQSGGLKAYYARGGFLLSRAVARGRSPAASKATIAWTTGYALGQVDGSHAMSKCTPGLPAPIRQFAAGEGFGWDVFATFDPVQITIKVTPHDAPFWSEAGSFAANQMKKLADFVCANQPVVQHLNTEVLGKELCHDTAMKPCAKAGAGCYCTPPTSIEKAAISVANKGLEVWCGRWVRPPDMPSETPFEPPIEPPKARPLLWLAGILGAIGGAVWFSRR